MSDSPTHSISANCPRCGYDQRGPVSTWTEQCPLDGTCSECGLVYRWAEVLQPEKFEPQWNIEYVKKWWRVPKAALVTLVQSLRPAQFWARLKMSHRVRPLRLTGYLLLLVSVGFLLAYVPLQVASAIRTRASVGQMWTMMYAGGSPYLAYHQQQLATVEQNLSTARAKGFGQSFIDDLEWERSQHQAMIAQLNAQTNTPVIIHQPYWRAVVEALMFPFSNRSWGVIQLPDGTTQPYPSPAEVTRFFGSYRSGRTGSATLQLMMTIACTAMYLTFMPATFVLLPASRRRAKVRWSHVWRVAAYSAGLPILVLMGAGALALILERFAGWSEVASLIEYAGIFVWIVAAYWWATAIRHYLKMPHAGAIAGLMTVMLALLLSPCLISILPRWLVWTVLG